MNTMKSPRKKGPAVGTTYRPRWVVTARQLSIHNPQERDRAIRFNDELEAFLAEVESDKDAGIFPLSDLDEAVVQQAIEAISVLQQAVVDGILNFETGEATRRARRNTPASPVGQYVLGRTNGRSE